MNSKSNEHDSYYIPPNFIEGGTIFGGMFKFRNVIKAVILATTVGVPIFMLDLTLTIKIVILCLTAIPTGLLALIRISGESLSSFIFGFFKFLKHHRVIGKAADKPRNQKKHKEKKKKTGCRKGRKGKVNDGGNSGGHPVKERAEGKSAAKG